MGGRISVESELGRGSIFTCELPLEIDPASPHDLAPAELRVTGVRKSEAPQGPMLVVDDNPDNRDLLVQLLSSLGFAVEAAADGAAAVSTWERLSPALIWMDLQMPIMDGYEAARLIHERTAQTGAVAPKIVAITASILEIDRSRLPEIGFDSYVTKPFREAEIYAALECLLGVEFIYAEGTDAAIESPVPPAAGDLSAGVARLAPALRLQLEEASTLADFERVEEAIQKIAATEPSLAKDLRELLESYRFDILQDLAQPPPTGAPPTQ
jgi:CheY-like chemotaxis protein